MVYSLVYSPNAELPETQVVRLCFWKDIKELKRRMDKKLYRSANDKILAGVCGGIGEYFNVDTVIIRLLWVVFTLMGGAGIIAYIIAAIIVPANPSGMNAEGYYTGSEDAGYRPERRNSSRNTSIALGVILMMFGGFILIKDYIPWIHRDIIAAAILICLGAFFLIRRR
jgi:phage shock protein C